MRKTIFLRFGSRNFQWTQVLGIFLAIITVLMLVKSAAVMFDSWQSVRDFDKCVDDAFSVESSLQPELVGLIKELKYQDCKDSLYEITGAQIPGGKVAMTTRQIATALVQPIAWFFFWAAAFMLAFFLLFNKALIVPIEEVEHVSRSFRRK